LVDGRWVTAVVAEDEYDGDCYCDAIFMVFCVRR
jgi:hypothetical protein